MKVKVLGKKGWEAMHAKPTLGQLGFGSSDELYFTQVFNHLKINSNILGGRC